MIKNKYLQSLAITMLLFVVGVIVDKLVNIEGDVPVPIWGLFCIGGFILSLVFLVVYLEKKGNEEVVVPDKNKSKKRGLKDILSRMELEKIETDNYITTIFLRRCFDPIQEPGVEEFLRGLEIHRPYCKCGNTFMFTSHKGLKIYYCNNKDGHKTVPYKYGFIEIEKELIEILNTFKGEVRRSKYKKYWKRYTDWYNELTNGNYDEYYPIYSFPINQIVFDK